MNPELIPHVPLFDSVRRRRHGELAALADEIHVPAGKTLIRKGALASEFFVVLDGVAEVTDEGRSLGPVGPGDCFGEVGLLRGPLRTATVRAATPRRLIVVGRREFASLSADFPEVGARIEARMLARAS